MTSFSRTERSRTQILDAADLAFRERGFSGVSMEEIARRAGLTRKTVYNLFPSKEDIALRLIARVEADDRPYRTRMAAGEDVRTLLEIILTDSAAWCLANPSLARLALAPAERPRPAPPADRPSFQGLICDVMALGQAQGVVRRDEDPGFLALVLLGIYGQAMLSALSAGVMAPEEIRRLIRIVIEGIGAPAAP
ncbi:TetR/AcrR family transcriptional regulator [Phenylobacterium sp.]|uniref:TetR/AcrR family transcriptional regulator n=1 Tax=Phenylobacterium sp. TaxID=1871053 RepID=UPI002FD8E5E6